MKRFVFCLSILVLVAGVAWAADGPNLIANSSMEFNSAGGKLPDGWSCGWTKGSPIWGVDNSESRTGSHSLMLGSNAADISASWANDMMPIQKGLEFEVGFYYKAANFDPAGGKISLTVLRHDSANLKHWQHREPEITVSNGSDWISYSATTTLSAEDTVGLSVSISLIQGPGTIWIDDVWVKVINNEGDSILPEPLTSLIASRQTQTSIRLNWVNPEQNKPCLYRVYRSESPDVPITPANLVSEIAGSQTEWIDQQILEGVKYFYVLVGINNMGETVTSNEVSASDYPRFGKNLLLNPSFEQWDDSTNPTSWPPATGTTPTAYSADVTDKKGGERSLKITNLSNTEYNRVVQNVTIKPNTNYVIIGWMKGEGIVKGPAGQGARLYSNRITFPAFEGTFGWTEVQREFNSGTNTTVQISPYLHHSTGKVWFDEVGLYEADSFDGTPPESPSNFEAVRVNGTDEVELTWDAPKAAPDGDFAEEYHIYKGSTLDSLIFIKELAGTNLSWQDTVAGDEQCYYKIVALDKVGNESISRIAFVEKTGSITGVIISNVDFEQLEEVELLLEGTNLNSEIKVDGTFKFLLLTAGEYTLEIRKKCYQSKQITSINVVPGEQSNLGEIILEWDDIEPNEPRNLEADGDSHVGLIKLLWKEPIPARDDEIADRYNVYRTTKEGVQPDTLIATVSETFYSDIIETNYYGYTFYYAIEAIDGAGNPSEKTSNVAFATVIIPPIPELVSPKTRELFHDKAPQFEWNLSNTPDELKGFRIELSTSPDFPSGKVLDANCDVIFTYTWEKGDLEQGLWYWRIRALYDPVVSQWSQKGEFVITKSDEDISLIPYVNIIPSVFRGASVQVCYLLSNDANIRLNIFDLSGKLIEAHALRQEAGYYEWAWYGLDKNNRELPNGLYIIQLNAYSSGGESIRVSKKVAIFR